MTEPHRRTVAESDTTPAPDRRARSASATDIDDSSASVDASAGNGHASPTAAQLRRFIKSRPYVPMHELRRRFELNGDLDDVCPVWLDGGTIVYVGLPQRESELLGGLARDGDIGLELSQDPQVPIVVGVYPMRPIARG